MSKKLRPEIDEYFLKIAMTVSERATCVRRKIGAVAVVEKHIIATGYNGAPVGVKDCLELGCLRDQLKIKSGSPHDICRSVHAEQNVISQAALHGTSLKGSTIYCTTAPCGQCARMLVNSGIKRYVCFINYPNQEARELFKNANISFEIHKEPSFSAELVGEQVLAISEKVFRQAGFFTGFKKANSNFYEKILQNVRYIDREDAEKNEKWKQIIPYILIKTDGKYLVTERLARSGEKRLHNAFALGVGGHINPKDSTSEVEGDDVIERGMARELNEEVWIEDLKSIKHEGYVYDESQDVSRHHLGFVYTAEAGSEDVKTLESGKLKVFFVDKKDLPKYLNGKEKWAELVYDNLIAENGKK